MNIQNELIKLSEYLEYNLELPIASNQIDLFIEDHRKYLHIKTFIPLEWVENLITCHNAYKEISSSRKLILRVFTQTKSELDFIR